MNDLLCLSLRFYKRLASYYTAFVILFISLFLYSCSGTEEVDPEAVKRAQDSTLLYGTLDKAFTHYQEGLEGNDANDLSGARKSFDLALKRLKAVNSNLLETPGYFLWKKDYNELATSIVQDYLATQSNIDGGSLVFTFADKLSVTYKKEEHVETVGGEFEPLPDGSDLPLIRNDVVDGFIEFWTNTDRGRSFIDKTIYRSGKFFPLMRKILRFHNAPEELVYLSVQESGLNPTIISRAGAVGLWQFMPATGMAYGLYQDGYRDDRRDFEKATDAAARHLIDLYRTYDDWYLAFAAYNAGPGRVNSAIRKSGSRDFWVLRRYLPGETKNYVPYILALSYVFRNPEEFGFENVEMGEPISYDRVEVKATLSFSRIAELCGSDEETIRELNTELLDDEIPPYEVAYQLRIPYGSYETFAENYGNASDFDKLGMNSPEYAGYEKFGIEKVTDITYTVAGYTPPGNKKIISSIGKSRVTHMFKENEQLSSVAINYSVRPTDIRIWNKIKYGKNPVKNQQLNIFVENEESKLEGKNDKDTNLDNSPVSNEPENENITENSNDNSSSNTNETSNKTFFGEKVNNTGIKTKTPNTKTTNTTTTYTKNDTETEKESVKENTEEEIYSETETNNTNTGEAQIYVVNEGDYLSTIAAAYGVTIEKLREWNGITGDVIYVNQKLKVYSDKKVSNVNTSKRKTSITHTVSEGEHLTMISQKYSVSVEDIREKNGLESDVIMVGQKLVITGNSTSTGNKKKIVKKTYKVQSGDNLTNIASKNDVSVKQIKDWNGLDNDVIKVGQVLKLYNNGSSNNKNVSKKKKSSKTKNTTYTKKRKRKN